MLKNLSALLAGLIFGLGLTISQMVNPTKVLGFLDLLGNWDPSLAFVMGGGLVVTFIGYRLVLRRPKPIADLKFQIPQKKEIDTKLATGAVLFGIGWGLVGLCPGPAIAALTIGGTPALIFLAAMIGGMVLFEAYQRFMPGQR
tara:strand:+ start:263 stop:691 length:429 start_codon:yes stop_codon:yes gene_type:complete